LPAGTPNLASVVALGKPVALWVKAKTSLAVGLRAAGRSAALPTASVISRKNDAAAVALVVLTISMASVPASGSVPGWYCVSAGIVPGVATKSGR